MFVRDRPYGEARGGEERRRLTLDPLAVLQRAGRMIGDRRARGRRPLGGEAEFRQDFADVAGERRDLRSVPGMG